MNIPPDLEDPNAPAGTPPPELDPNSDFALKKQGSKTPMIVAGVVVVGVLGFFVVRAMQTQKTREMHAAVIKQFADIEKEEVTGKFWACLFGPGIDPAMFPNNLALSQRLDSAFATDPKNFPARVREECTPKAIDAKHRVEGITAPPEYAEPLKAYAASLQGLSEAFDAWAKVAPSHVAEKMVGQKVETDGAAWHAFQSGKPDAGVIAYDHFLHCAVPGIDKMKDGQALVEFLFNSVQGSEVPRAAAERVRQRDHDRSRPAGADARLQSRHHQDAGRRSRAVGVRRLPAQGAQAEALGRQRRRGPLVGHVHGRRPQGPRSRQGSPLREVAARLRPPLSPPVSSLAIHRFRRPVGAERHLFAHARRCSLGYGGIKCS